MAVLGLDRRTLAGVPARLLGRADPFPEQLDKIQEWHLQWRPEQIGIESNAFQRALAQQAMRLEGFPGIVPVFSKGKKEERILSMAPLFKIGRSGSTGATSSSSSSGSTSTPQDEEEPGHRRAPPADDLLDAEIVEIAHARRRRCPAPGTCRCSTSPTRS
jgi:hypothetical protein